MKNLLNGLNYLRIMALTLALLIPQVSFAARKSPVDGGVVTSGVGWRLDPFGSGRMVSRPSRVHAVK